MLRTSPPSAIWPRRARNGASWPATASSSGRSCKTFTSPRAYGQRAGTFLSNAGVLQVFGVAASDRRVRA
jgi:hypothetical protein